MTSWMSAVGSWVADYYLLASLLLVVAWVAMARLTQPVRRVAVGWGAMVGLTLLAVICALPSWPRIPIVTADSETSPSSGGFSPTLSDAPSQTPQHSQGRRRDNSRISEGDSPIFAARKSGQSPSRFFPNPQQPAAGAEPRAGEANVAKENAFETEAATGNAGDAETAEENASEAEAAKENAVPESSPQEVEDADASQAAWARGEHLGAWSAAHWRPAVAAVFLTGAALVALWLGWGALYVAVLCKRAVDAPAWLQAELASVVRGKARPPRLLLSQDIRTAVAVGLLRPTVILPWRLTEEGSETGLHAALAHEWAHVGNRDLWLLAGGRFLLLVMFAHPLYWWLRRRIRDDQEAVADSTAALGVSRRGYAQALLDWARIGMEQPPTGAAALLGIWERRSFLARRVSMLLNEKMRVETRCPRRWQLGFLGLSVLLALAMSVLTIRPGSSVVAQDGSPTTRSESQPASARRAGARFAPAPQRDAPRELRYRWEADQQFAYEVEITAELPSKVETLKGVISYQVKSEEEPLKVTYRGALKKSTKEKPGSSSAVGRFGPPGFGPLGARRLAMGPFGPGGPFGRSSDAFQGLTQTTNELTLTPRGHILTLEGTSQLPYLIGNLSLLVFEPLPESDKPFWRVDSGIAITEKGKGSRSPGPPLFAPRGPFGPFGDGDKPEKTTSGSESVSFTHGGDSGHQSTYLKIYQLHSAGDDEETSIEGNGSWTFNRELGISESLDFSQRLVVTEGNTSLTVPVTVKYHRLSADEWARIERERQEAERQRREEAERILSQKKAKAEAPIEGDDRKQVLAALKSDNLADLESTLKMLAGKTDRSDEEIARAIEPLLKHGQSSVRRNAEKALVQFSPSFKRKVDLTRAYNRFAPLPETGPQVTDETLLLPGLIIAASRHNAETFYPAKVLQVLDDGLVEIQYQREPWQVQRRRSDLRLAPPEVEQPHVDPELLALLTSGDAAGQAFRTWTDDTGAFTMEAKCLGVEDESVRLLQKDGKEIEVPLARLGQVDREFAEGLRRLAEPSNPFEP